jgi:S-adenosylmethionine decarboxylase
MLEINELLVDLYGCQGNLDDEKFLCRTLEEAAENVNAKIIKRITQRFSPTGVTVILILAETHISIHTWPEHGYAALDIFICGEGKSPEPAWEAVRKALKPESFKTNRLKRTMRV